MVEALQGNLLGHRLLKYPPGNGTAAAECVNLRQELLQTVFLRGILLLVTVTGSSEIEALLFSNWEVLNFSVPFVDKFFLIC